MEKVGAILVIFFILTFLRHICLLVLYLIFYKNRNEKVKSKIRFSRDILIGSFISVIVAIILQAEEMPEKIGIPLSIIPLIFIVGKRDKEEKDNIKQNKENNINKIIEKHISVLSVKRDQLLIPDEYGIVDSKRWINEINRFYSTVLSPQVGEIKDYIHIIDSKILEYYDSNASVGFSDAMSPLEYEQYCTQLLLNLGWNARTTKASGDQGCDIIAELNGVKIVLQCKLYTKPVGNKAVQEIFAAKSHENANLAVVVTNSSYTKSARQIAVSTGIALLHHEQLQGWVKSLAIE